MINFLQVAEQSLIGGSCDSLFPVNHLEYHPTDCSLQLHVLKGGFTSDETILGGGGGVTQLIRAA